MQFSGDGILCKLLLAVLILNVMCLLGHGDGSMEMVQLYWQKDQKDASFVPAMLRR